ncbi:ankyrin repeat domain-containing protein [bacterium]|nr:ankyrin repeat domain-containing protein [bacterium]
MVRVLLEAGANRETKAQNGATALWWARQYGHTSVVRLLEAPLTPPVGVAPLARPTPSAGDELRALRTQLQEERRARVAAEAAAARAQRATVAVVVLVALMAAAVMPWYGGGGEGAASGEAE